VRTAWLYGPPGTDFPAKILAAAAQATTNGTRLRLVIDEIGSPTRVADLAVGIVDFVRARPAAGIYHLVNAGRASRAEWAAAVLDGVGLRVATERVSASAWERASMPPAWGVLGTGRAAELGIILRDWRAALFDELPRYRALAADLEMDGVAR
jgi:dTDP-4-dehydrorhamnose reductase